MHARIAERIADAAALPPHATVVEIGPGTGMLTRPLLARAAKVVALEADGELVALLREKLHAETGEGRLDLRHADVREFDPSTLPGPYHVVANIPYYLTGEIVRMFLSTAAKPSSMTLLVQKEVAERAARGKKESLLSLAIKAYGVPEYAFTVPKGAFRPSPKVDSAVLHIGNIRRDAFATREAEQRFFEVLRAGFAHKRKLLSGNLAVLAPKERVQEALKAAGMPDKARAEDVPLAAWQTMAETLSF